MKEPKKNETRIGTGMLPWTRLPASMSIRPCVTPPPRLTTSVNGSFVPLASFTSSTGSLPVGADGCEDVSGIAVDQVGEPLRDRGQRALVAVVGVEERHRVRVRVPVDGDRPRLAADELAGELDEDVAEVRLRRARARDDLVRRHERRRGGVRVRRVPQLPDRRDVQRRVDDSRSRWSVVESRDAV